VTDPISLGKQKSGGKNKNKQQHRDEPKQLQLEEEYVEQKTGGAQVEQSAAEDASSVDAAETVGQEVIDGPVEIRHSDVMGRSVSHHATKKPWSMLVFILLKKHKNVLSNSL
jgi:F0F1-type ATP synthase assembly protein I